MAYCMKKVGIKAIVASEKHKTQNFYEMLCSIVPEIKTSPNGVITSSEYGDLRSIVMDSPNDLQ